MPNYLMLDHGGVLDDRIVFADEVADNDIELGSRGEGLVSILKD